MDRREQVKKIVQEESKKQNPDYWKAKPFNLDNIERFIKKQNDEKKSDN